MRGHEFAFAVTNTSRKVLFKYGTNEHLVLLQANLTNRGSFVQRESQQESTALHDQDGQETGFWTKEYCIDNELCLASFQSQL
jgi:hypothetical protein